MPLAPLPPSTVKLIGSSQVITSVSSVIKELMENSLDSGAQHIEIKLDKHGLEKIEVKDDGCGIGKSDATVMCLPSYTSKILNFSDLDRLSSYGFRGEALSSLCNVAQVSVTTKTAEDDVATCYSYDHNGQVICSKISHISKGTIVTVTDLFKTLPVRKQFVSSSKRAAEELKRVEKVVNSLGMVHPRLRVTLIHNKFLIWQKTSVANLRQSIMQVVSINIVKQLHHILHSSDQIRIEMLVPKRDCDVSSLCFSNFTDAYFLFINNRPIRNQEVEKAVKSKLFEFFGVYVPANKYPLCVTCLILPPDCLDVNLEPNKTQVYFKNQDEVLDLVSQCLHIYYGEGKREEEENLHPVKLPKKRKVEEEYQIDSKKVNSEKNENCIMVEATNPSVEQGIQFFESPLNLGESQTSSETVICSDESTSKQELDLADNDVECIFEEFCTKRENESRNTVQSGSTYKDRPHQGLGTSENSLYIFPHESNKQLLDDNESSEIKNEFLNDLINRNQNINRQTDLEFEMKDKNTSSKNMVDCLKKASEISTTVKKIKTMEAYLSKSNNSLPVQDDSPFGCIGEDNCHTYNRESGRELCDQKAELIINDVHEHNIEACSPTLSQWSKGEVLTTTGAKVQGPQLLARRTDPGSPSSSPEITNRSVSSQMGCKEMSAFTKFARKMRKEILEEQPDLSFTKVAQMLQVHWRHLDSDAKKTYEETVKIKKSPVSAPPSKQKTISSFLDNVPNIELEISIDKIKKMVKEPIIEDEGEIRLVGHLEASPLWLYHRQGSGVFTLSVTRLLEAVNYHKYLADFALPSKLLSEYITIAQSDLSAEEWRLLLSLERSLNGVINDKRFTHNGLLIEIMEGETEAHLTYVPQNISFYGLEEVKEILCMLQTHGPDTSLAQCRPLKVSSFIRSEVMRECSQQEPPSQTKSIYFSR